ncbi:MAG: excisionase family DNA-binding protein, partial [Oscillospiraceae bacterium]|nr:excisionase family DNA-binding protein [Oscillospiraceae bacterium]
SEISYGTSKYLDEQEAAAYLNLTEDEVLSLIRSGEITEYVKTGTGYSISVDVLDEWFDNEAYQNKLNTVETDVDTAE